MVTRDIRHISLVTPSNVELAKESAARKLTAIDAGALQGDLASRLITVELERIPDSERKFDHHLACRFEALRPRLLGTLLDLAANVLRVLPEIDLPELPRMADWAHILAAVDAVLHTKGLHRYESLADRIAGDPVEDTPVAKAVSDLAGQGHWSGTAHDLLDRISPDDPPKGWPQTPRALSGQLRRYAPALRTSGITIEFMIVGRGNHKERRISVGTVAGTVGTVGVSGSALPFPQNMASELDFNQGGNGGNGGNG